MKTRKDGLSPDVRRRYLRYRRVVYGIQVTCNALVTFQFVVPATLGEQLTLAWSLSPTSLGFLGSSLFYLYALMQVPSGYFADTWGPRWTVTVAMLVMAAGQFTFALASGFETALVGRALTGLGSGLVLISVLKIQANWFRIREFATLAGIVCLVGFGGSMLATTPLAVLALQWGWQRSLLVVGGIALALGALNWVIVRDDPREVSLPSVDQIDPDSAAVLTTTSGLAETGYSSRLTDAVRIWLRTPRLWMSSLILLLGFGSFLAFQSLWAGPYLTQVHHRSQVAASGLLLMLSIGAGLGATVSGYLSDKVFQARRPFLVGGTLGVAAAWAWTLATMDGAGTTVISLSFMLLGFSAGFILIAQTMVKEFVRPEVFGVIFGIVNMFPFVGNALFQLLMGWLLNASRAIIVGGSRVYSPAGYSLAFTPAAVAGVLCVILSLFVPESLKRTPKEGDLVKNVRSEEGPSEPF